jgi:hypothetical protein
MKTKYYFSIGEEENCYTLDYHLDSAKDKELTEIELYEAIPYKDPNYFWCSEVGEVGEKGECGKMCDYYKPKNGKNGICQSYGIYLYETGNKIKFNVLTGKRI